MLFSQLPHPQVLQDAGFLAQPLCERCFIPLLMPVDQSNRLLLNAQACYLDMKDQQYVLWVLYLRHFETLLTDGITFSL